MRDKKEFIREYFPDLRIEDIHFTQIDLDITDLSIADVLRNINAIYPTNSIDRNKIATGQKVIAVLCKSKYLFPLSGIMIILSTDDIQLNIMSKNYIVLSISEAAITTNDKIAEVVDSISTYFVNNYAESLEFAKDFFVRCLYDQDADEGIEI